MASTPAERHESELGLFDQLVRLVGRASPGPTVAAPPPTTAIDLPASTSASAAVQEQPYASTSTAGEPHTAGEPLQRTPSVSSSNSQSRLKRLNVGERLKKLGRDIKRRSKSSAASPRLSSTSIEIEPAPEDTANSSSNPTPGRTGGAHAKLLSMVAEGDEEPGESSTGGTSTGAATQPPEPTTLAQRIQALIDAMPFPAPRTPSSKRIPQPKPPARDASGRPIPPAPPAGQTVPVTDSLRAALASATMMNGAGEQGRPSMWSVLEGIGAPAHGFPPVSGSKTTPNDGDGDGSGDDGGSSGGGVFSSNSSVMIYSPLQPGDTDLPELAELIALGDEEELVAAPSSPAPNAIPFAHPVQSWAAAIWPLSLLASKQLESGPTPRARRSGETVMSPARLSVDAAGRVVRVQTVRAWVPSATKISVQAMWWGYRLYLPPPVLATLSSSEVETVKRAALITAALTWFFNNLPVAALPPAVQPAAQLLQRIVPYLGYIGTFISWSWGQIEGYNEGYGVILTATWLLPIALVPGTWNKDDFPTSPTQTPAPLPPSTPAPPASAPLPSTPAPTTPTSPAPTPPTPANPTHAPTTPASTIPAPTTPAPAPTTPSSPTPSTPAPPASAPTASTTPPGSPLTPRPRKRSVRARSPSAAAAAAATSVRLPVARPPVEVPPVPPSVSVSSASAFTGSGSAAEAPTAPVPPSSPLGQRLLSGPVLAPVPLPAVDDDADGKGRWGKRVGLFSRTRSREGGKDKAGKKEKKEKMK